MIPRVRGFIRQERLLRTGGRYLVALSGGADSVALLAVLHELGYAVEAAHCNFHLRGEESVRDEQFCIALCERMGIVLHRAHFDTRAYAETHKVSIEMAARELRYGYFEQLRRDLRLDDVCVAHHRDDQVETVLMNLIRGTGVRGLAGMMPRNGHVVRPFLCVTRDEIEDFLSQRGQEYVTDSTNRVDDVVRNRIRLNVIPMLKSINPAVCENIRRTAHYIKEVEKVCQSSAEPYLAQLKIHGFIERNQLLAEPSPSYLLFQLLTPYGFSSPQIEQIAAHLDAPTGRTWQSKTHELLFDRDRICVEPIASEVQRSLKIPETGTYVIADDLKLRVEVMPIDDTFTISRDKNRICLDYKQVEFPLEVRRCAVGDRFSPFGMRGSRLVSDFLTDQKKSLFEKRRQLVLVNSNNDILWVIRERPDNRYRITEKSAMALVVTAETT